MMSDRDRDELNFDDFVDGDASGNDRNSSFERNSPFEDDVRGQGGGFGPSPFADTGGDESGAGPAPLPSNEMFENRLGQTSEASGGRRFPMQMILGVVMLAIFGGVGYLAYSEYLGVEEAGEAPLVMAEGPIKMRPSDPGGLDVPHKDIEVFNRIRPGELSETVTESLLPSREEPVDVADGMKPIPSMFGNEQRAVDRGAAEPDEEVTSAPSAASPTSLLPDASESGAAVTETRSPKTARPKSVEFASPPKTPRPAQAEAPKQQTAAKPPASAAVPSGRYLVQLASVRSRESISGSWSKLQGRHRDLLGALQLNIQRADLGADRGVFYRMQAGSFTDRDSANSLCSKLKARSVDCLVVKN